MARNIFVWIDSFLLPLQCDINCGNDTVDCLAKKLPSNQKLDVALGVPQPNLVLMKVTGSLTSGDALLQRVTMSSILSIVHNLFAQDLYSFKQKRNLLSFFYSLLCQMSVKLKLEFKNKLSYMQTDVISAVLLSAPILQNLCLWIFSRCFISEISQFQLTNTFSCKCNN